MSWTSTRAKIAATRRHHPDQPVPDDLLREHAVERIASYVRKVIDEAPPLTAEQRSRLAVLLLAPERGAA